MTQICFWLDFSLGNGTVQTYGTSNLLGGERGKSFDLLDGEYLVALTVKSGTMWDGCAFLTSSGRQSSWYGGRGGGKETTYRASIGYHITGLQMNSDGKLPLGIIEQKMGSVITFSQVVGGELLGHGHCVRDGHMGWHTTSALGYDDCRMMCIKDGSCKSFSVDLSGNFCALQTIKAEAADGNAERQCYVKRVVSLPEPMPELLENSSELSAKQCTPAHHSSSPRLSLCSSLAVRRLGIMAGVYIDQVQFSFDGGVIKKYGREGGTQMKPFELHEGEYLVALTVHVGDHWDGCQFITNTGRQSDWYGGRGGKEVTYCASPGFHITGVQMREDRRKWPMGIYEEAIECKPQKQTQIWNRVLISILVIVVLGLCGHWWQAQAAASQRKLDQLTVELNNMQGQCEHWRRYSDQQDRNTQIEISRCKNERDRCQREIRQLRVELSASHEHSENWRRHSEQQLHDLRREVSRRKKAEQRVFDAAPEAYQEQLKELAHELTSTQRIHQAETQAYCDEIQKLKMQLQVAQQNCDDWRSHVEQHKRNLEHQIQQSKDAWVRYNEEVTKLKKDLGSALEDSQSWHKQVKRQEREMQALHRKISEVEHENSNLKRHLRSSPSLPFTSQQLAEKIAEHECRPLGTLKAEARQSFKKKLLIKWHPDKQPNAEHVDLATCVMQALQNRSEWE